MSTVSIIKIGGGFLQPGATSVPQIWKNPPVQNVIGFWVAPKKLVGNEILLGPVAFQLISVTSKMDLPNHFIVELIVKNTGSASGAFELFMSFLA